MKQTIIELRTEIAISKAKLMVLDAKLNNFECSKSQTGVELLFMNNDITKEFGVLSELQSQLSTELKSQSIEYKHELTLA